MTEIHVVTARNVHLYTEVLESYYRWRHRIYVEERGWTDLRQEDELEKDQFDTLEATHLIALDNGKVVGGSRLIPMSAPTLLSEVFSDLVERGDVPRDSRTIDWTRMFVVPSHRLGRQPRSVGGALFCGVMEYCLSIEAERVGGVMETFWLPRWQEFGWTTRPLGLPREIDGSMTLAAFVDVSECALQGVRDATGWNETLLVHDRAPAPNRVLSKVA